MGRAKWPPRVPCEVVRSRAGVVVGSGCEGCGGWAQREIWAASWWLVPASRRGGSWWALVPGRAGLVSREQWCPSPEPPRRTKLQLNRGKPKTND